MFKKSKNIFCLLAILLLPGFAGTAWAAGSPVASLFDNILAVSLISLMLLLLIIIGILANILISSADVKRKKDKKSSAAPAVSSMLVLLLLSSSSLFAQNGPGAAASTTAGTIGGMSASTFYIMVSVIFLELLVIIVLLVNIKALLRVEKEKLIAPEIKARAEAEKKSRLSWWDRFNKLRPVTQEAELDLGHEYDGIRELNNRLPPWWIYGFYLTIVFAGIYLWRFHISHTGPSSREEFETSVARGERKVQEYLKMKGENVDENTVTLLTEKADLDAGKAIFVQDGLCGTCHGKDGSGMVNGVPGVGPNLADDYWIHGGDLKNIFKAVKYGVSGKGMPEWGNRFSPKEIAQISSYVKSLRGTNPPVHKTPDGQLYKEEQPVFSQPAADSLKNAKDSVNVKGSKIAMAK